ncbi:MAG: CoA transferase [Gammaproteobacteria bacterium]|nr:CoA transferase [Gammaproteobacteria bacterium]
MAAVLQGLKVVEFTHMVAGPSCGQVLGDFGADVTKVEPPQGDVTRRMGPMAGDVAALYASTNRNKKVVCLDITQPDQAAKAQALACAADVVISNLSPAMLAKAGLDGPALRKINPRVISVIITGFGAAGPAGTDGLAQASTGLMSATGPVGGPGFRTGASVVDVTTGVWAALGVLAALDHRRQTGEGDCIQVSLADTCLYMQYAQIGLHGADPKFARRNGNHSTVSCTPMMNASDGRLLTTVLTSKHWQALCRTAGLPLEDDPRFATNELRWEAQALIEELFDPAMRQKTRAEWTRLLRAAGVPCGPERDYAEVVQDDDLHRRGMLFRLGESLQVRMPLEFENTERVEARPPPRLPASA